MENNKNSTSGETDFTVSNLTNSWVTTASVPLSTISTTVNPNNTIAAGVYYDTDSVFRLSNLAFLVNFMTEEDIDKVLSTVSLRLKSAKDEDNTSFKFKSAVSEIVRSRHFSEEFLMKYISYLSKNDVLRYHSGDIQSGEYNTVGLYYEVSE